MFEVRNLLKGILAVPLTLTFLESDSRDTIHVYTNADASFNIAASLKFGQCRAITCTNIKEG